MPGGIAILFVICAAVAAWTLFYLLARQVI